MRGCACEHLENLIKQIPSTVEKAPWVCGRMVRVIVLLHQMSFDALAWIKVDKIFLVVAEMLEHGSIDQKHVQST